MRRKPATPRVPLNAKVDCWMTEEMYDRMCVRAAAKGFSVSAHIRSLIQQDLDAWVHTGKPLMDILGTDIGEPDQPAAITCL